MLNSKADAVRGLAKSRRKRALVPAPRAVASADTVFVRVVEAIQSHRLAPGMRLVEEQLGKHFGVSRTIVRHGIAKLAQAGLVDMLPNRGAKIATPDARRTREVFDARRLIESDLVARVARDANSDTIAVLRKHLQAEDEARRRGDSGLLVRLTGEFHLILARAAGNRVLAQTLEQIEAITCLAILAHGRPDDKACPPDEHSAIVDAIEAGNAKLAVTLMREHLDHVVAGLDLAPEPLTNEKERKTR
jgi:DNA-binding GntR family transcriptional regulator